MSERPRFSVTDLAAIEALQVLDGQLAWKPVRRQLGVRAFGINAYTADRQGAEVVEEHAELASGHEELYIVISGHAVFTLDGEEVDAPAVSLVFIPEPSVRRHATAKSAGTTVLAIGATPGEAFTPSAWEHWFAAAPAAAAGDYATAAETVAAGLDEHPDHPALLYNLACYEAQAGMVDAALEHLARAVERDPQAREWASDDTDLDSLRADPRFASAVAGEP